MVAHKYIKRTGVQGQYRYWYKTPEGKLVEGDNPDKPKIPLAVGKKVRIKPTAHHIGRGLIGTIKEIGRDVVKLMDDMGRSFTVPYNAVEMAKSGELICVFLKSATEDMTVKEAMKHKNKKGAGSRKRKKLKSKKAKFATVMSEFKRGTLHSGSGEKVKSKKQAQAIAFSESGQSNKSLEYKDVIPMIKSEKKVSLVFFKAIKGTKKLGVTKKPSAGSKMRGAPIGEKRTWGGKEYQKVGAGQWKKAPKGRGKTGDDEKEKTKKPVLHRAVEKVIQALEDKKEREGVKKVGEGIASTVSGQLAGGDVAQLAERTAATTEKVKESGKDIGKKFFEKEQKKQENKK